MPRSRRPRSWLEDFSRRARLEAPARAAYPTLRHRRVQRHDGPVHVYEATVPVNGYDCRRVTLEFEGRLEEWPKVYADGPAGADASPHRHADRQFHRLCLWHHDDPPERRWVAEDGLLALFGMASEHLFKEAFWREHHQWLGEEYPHGDPPPNSNGSLRIDDR
jgi:hypothetical protein